MPFKDPAKKREYQKRWLREKRESSPGTCRTHLPSPLRIVTAQGILAELGEQIEAVKADIKAGTLEKARCIGFLAGVALRAVETAGIESRLEALEEKININIREVS